MKKTVIASIALLLAACGDEVTEVTNNYQSGVEVVDSLKDLPKCTDDNEGDQAFVKKESSARICVDGDWTTMNSENSGADFSCKTVELKDKSGLKIVCNGDSIGVVLNGSDGKDGKAGKDGSDGEDGKAGTGCSMTDKTDSTITVKCGDSTMVIELGVGANADTAEADSERVPLQLASLEGFTQKGPFLKGSTVYLYELSDGRTLKQTNGNFTSYITRDDGRYKFSARDLVSQYAMIVVDGNYRNEVTGGVSDSPIRLRAITDMRKRSSANVNLLTTLEFDRVYHLVTRGDNDGKKLTVKQAKKQAQAEILAAFHIELDEKTDAEDMDVFGATDADAALLAISIMLQGDGSSTDLSVLLTSIANDMEEDGEWNDTAAKVKIADWAAMADGMGRLENFRKNVAGWGLSDTVPVFEKFVRKFYTIETGLGKCGCDNIPVGTIKGITNSKSGYRDELYSDSASMIRFVCDDAEKARWRVLTDLDKDTTGWGEGSEGEVRNGRLNPNLTYVYQDGSWRHGTAMDSLLVKEGGSACLVDKDTSEVKYDNVYYVCMPQSTTDTVRKWVVAPDIYNDTHEAQAECKDLGVYGHGNFLTGRVNTWLSYVCDENVFRPVSNTELIMTRACVSHNDNEIYKLNGSFYRCKDKNWTRTAKRDSSTVTDPRDGRTYKTILIGSQHWMAENINYSTRQSYCYSGLTSNCLVYGRLYTWATARSACPSGWHLPSEDEWNTLIYAQGSAMGQGSRLKSTTGWSDYGGDSGNGTDSYGFNALPAGHKSSSSATYEAVGERAHFWTADSSASSNSAISMLLRYDNNNATLIGNNRNYGYSVRCLQDD